MGTPRYISPTRLRSPETEPTLGEISQVPLMPTPLELQPLLSRVLALWRALVAGLARILSRWLGARPAPAGDVLAGLDAKLRPSGERPMLTPSGLPR